MKYYTQYNTQFLKLRGWLQMGQIKNIEYVLS